MSEPRVPFNQMVNEAFRIEIDTAISKNDARRVQELFRRVLIAWFACESELVEALAANKACAEWAQDLQQKLRPVLAEALKRPYARDLEMGKFRGSFAEYVERAFTRGKAGGIIH